MLALELLFYIYVNLTLAVWTTAYHKKERVNYMSKVAYYAPRSLEDAVTYRRNHPQATPFAGGTDLLVGLEYEKVTLTDILDLKALTPELGYIREEEGNWKIGALATVSQLANHPELGKKFPFLCKAASMLGSWQVRGSATVGGNLCNGAPSAELTPCWMVLDAKVVIAGPNGEHTMPVVDFLVGPGKVKLAADELLKEIVIERQDPRLEGGYNCRKLRRSMDVAIVNMAVSAVTDHQGVVRQAKVVLGAVGPVAFRVPEAEAALVGTALTKESVASTEAICRAAAKPIDDIRSTAKYRREMVGICMREMLTELGKGDAQ